MQSSVIAKWLERLCLGPRPELAILHRAPLWGFRLGLCAARLVVAAQCAIHAMLNFSSFSASDKYNMGASAGEGDTPGVLLFDCPASSLHCCRLALRRRALQRTFVRCCTLLSGSVSGMWK